MAQHHEQQLEKDLLEHHQHHLPKDNMLDCVMAIEAALLPCLPARELQAIDRSTHPSHQIDVERHARDFMEAAKRLQCYFNKLQQDKKPTTEEMLTKEIVVMEKELKAKSELIKRYEKFIEGWRTDLKAQLEKHKMELERV
ncbi:mediator of RNA polymerase II transcription subunit 28 [Nymphaea colorata]|nr:mediator of RNA polymerase II transcription subunit 28 [Nymphaea colorata]XP_031488995.1 mediator of RNA polymerase II transcription subunit 28 [Nymphaea colorata]XP_031488996.1 mediator of RNA polymerase II transcription subunit 28 [Nymphaea colorata]XP_031488997.1 mediator of RNA polymerase II transcription subunit 28 [Nymphaea colorata]XP_031488998.1 mediator of RNA polymerase II transcription subunit 28 [Nymphaea colorata]XP_031488999.1 mediator of RNA polymerase II transcription subuni